jgi:DNA polymerase III subunit epsilon
MYLFFDTETTGLPKSYSAPATDINNWPRVVQIGWCLQDKEFNIISSGCYITKPEGFIIPSESTKIHGITTEIAMEKGEDIKKILKEFSKDIEKASILIAHNINFDYKILSAEFVRMDLPNQLISKKKFCTMKGTINFCKISTNRGYKWPKLSELHKILFDQSFEGEHNAYEDTIACARCFRELKRKGVVNLGDY